MGIKTCTKCHEDLPSTSEYFNKRTRSVDGLQPLCKVCENIINWRYYKNNTESRLINVRAYAKKNQHKTRERNIKKIYGKEIQDIMDMMTFQKGCCAICNESLINPDSIKNYAIDHNHSTGKVRGLLCNNCNTSLGLMKENREAILEMVKYLDQEDD